jgi:hypothetical protein
MGTLSVTQQEREEKVQQSLDSEWEKSSYQEGCALARQQAVKRLEEIEERLFLKHSPSWQVIGFRERTFITCFGEVKVKRRLYRDGNENYHFALDEYLGWLPKQIATPDLQESLVELATQVPFRAVGEILEKLTAGILSVMTIHRLVSKTAECAIEKEKTEWHAVFARGQMPLSGGRQVTILFIEGDGTFINLQREKQKDYEIKHAIAYEGWERLPQKDERYRVVGKRVYCHANEEIPFWEGASLEWNKKWNPGYSRVIIGGDGATWIDKGEEEFPDATRQLDGFHLARACGRGWEEGKAIYEAIRAGEVDKARELIRNSKPRQGAGTDKSRNYVTRNIEKGKDWRGYSNLPAVNGYGTIDRALGTMESNEDKLAANRMKKRGLSWTKKGALRMNKVIQLAFNEEMRQFCLREKVNPGKEKSALPRTKRVGSDGQQEWLETRLPALIGPHASYPWVELLRARTQRLILLN